MNSSSFIVKIGQEVLSMIRIYQRSRVATITLSILSGSILLLGSVLAFDAISQTINEDITPVVRGGTVTFDLTDKPQEGLTLTSTGVEGEISWAYTTSADSFSGIVTGVTKKVFIKSRGGKDIIDVSNLTIPIDLHIISGKGDDEVTVADSVIGRTLIVDSGPGADTVTARNVSAARIIRVVTSHGNDAVTMSDIQTYRLNIFTGNDDDTLSLGSNVKTEGVLNIALGQGMNSGSFTGIEIGGNTVVKGGGSTDQIYASDSTFSGSVKLISGGDDDALSSTLNTFHRNVLYNCGPGVNDSLEDSGNIYHSSGDPSAKGCENDGAPPADIVPPVITLLGENPLELSLGDEFADPGATATDIVEGDLTSAIVVEGDTVDTNSSGTYVISYDVMDAAGNSAQQISRRVIVLEDQGEQEDTTTPVITLLGDNPIEIEVGTPFEDPGATATDDIDGDLTASIVVTGDTIDPQTAGSYLIIYNVVDTAGNAAGQVVRNVLVLPPDDGLPPDPGEAGKLTLEGIDSDNDGVRDDVQRAIILGDNEPTIKSALLQSARARQKALVEADDPSKQAENERMMADTRRCIYELFPETREGVREAAIKVLSLSPLIYNTDERLKKQVQIQTDGIPKVLVGSSIDAEKCSFIN